MSWVLEKRNKRTEDGVKLIASRDTAETIRSGARRQYVLVRGERQFIYVSSG